MTEHLLVAEDGAQALRLLATACLLPNQAQCPQLILLDLNMPVLNGIEFLQAYQHLPAAQRQGIVYCCSPAPRSSGIWSNCGACPWTAS
ncbi:response regulator [Hymenobacter sp. AT01-02]|uniref:response regulator n=1 Tax=Hymenobacter sp. AT01-02 TaxID=1571877 RepID=UPI0006E2339E|nr:response regulator [Hymenobacter sp. AT01-02]